MKGFAWAKIDDKKIDDTIWDKRINDDQISLNVKELEEIFCAVAPPKPEPAHGENDGPQRPKKKETIILLDPRKSNNCSIMLSRFGKIDYKEIKKAILECDEEILTPENVGAMKQFVPTSEDIEILKEYSGDIASLGKAEQYYMAIMDIPKLAGRLNALHTKLTLQPKLETAKESIAVVTAAVKQVRNSKLLPKMLELVLAMGNYLNAGSFRGGAYGFKMETLPKLVEVRAVDPKINMMHYIAQLCETNEKYSDLLKIGEELNSLSNAARESIPQMQTDLNKLKGELNTVENILKALESDSSNKLVRILKQFHEGAAKDLEGAIAAQEALANSYKELLSFFGEAPTTDSQSFFCNLTSFLEKFDQAQKENVRRKQMAEKAKLAEQRRAEMAAKIAARKKGGDGAEEEAAAPAKKPGGGRNVLDNLIADMRTGQAFAPPSQGDMANEALAVFARLKKTRGPPKGLP